MIIHLFYVLLAERAASERSRWKGSAEERAVQAEQLITAADGFAHPNSIEQVLAVHLRAVAARLRA